MVTLKLVNFYNTTSKTFFVLKISTHTITIKQLIMSEFEILQIAHNSFQQNAAYLLVVTILLCLNFYLIRRAREINMPVYGKGLTTIFGLMTINFGWTVGTFLRGTQIDMAFRLSELKAKGIDISMASDNWIEFMEP